MRYEWPRTLVFVLFAFLMTPQSYVIRHGISWEGQAKSLLLLAVLLLSIAYPLADRSSKARGEGVSPQTTVAPC